MAVRFVTREEAGQLVILGADVRMSTADTKELIRALMQTGYKGAKLDAPRELEAACWNFFWVLEE